MKAIQHAVLADLPDIDDVAPFNSADQALFDELRAVLEKHGAASRFGVTLLHKHFDVAADEVLVEVCDVDARTMTIRPRAKFELSRGNVVETNWRLDSRSATQECLIDCVTERGGHPRTHIQSTGDDD
jgi:hypothetical protein